MDHRTMSWTILLALGAFHGINPAMGWLFAVALGMQERKRIAVWRSLLPLGAGHALAVAVAILLAILAGVIVPIRILRWFVALVLIIFAMTRMVRHRHPRWASMQVGMGRLTLWSFLMASAHGAGLMVVPVFIGMHNNCISYPNHAISAVDTSSALMAMALHAAGYMVVTALIAALVFEKLGVGILRNAWFNVDLIWSVALIASGVLTVML
jgi:hypothetical protein